MTRHRAFAERYPGDRRKTELHARSKSVPDLSDNLHRATCGRSADAKSLSVCERLRRNHSPTRPLGIERRAHGQHESVDHLDDLRGVHLSRARISIWVHGSDGCDQSGGTDISVLRRPAAQQIAGSTASLCSTRSCRLSVTTG